MPYQATIFETLLKELPRRQFDQLVTRHKADYRSRHLSSWSHLVAMVFAQLSGSQSLRDLEGGLNSQGNLLYHLGTTPVHRATLSDANRSRRPEIFEEVFGLLLQRLQGQLRRQMKGGAEVLRLLDSTLLPLPAQRAAWASCWRKTTGVKAHMVYDPHADVPIYYTLTKARINDITEAKEMPLERGATYVFDRGYYDYGWWAKLTEHDCRFVTRLKKNTHVNIVETRAVIDEGIKSDVIFKLNERMARSRKNPYQGLLREVVIIADNGKKLRLVSNDLHAPAQEIAALYKARWQVELFFKWIKQNLKIKRFLGLSMNAIKIQIATALIAFMLLRLARQKAPAVLSMQALARLIRVNLMHRKPMAMLFEPPPPRKQDPAKNNQIQWTF